MARQDKSIGWARSSKQHERQIFDRPTDASEDCVMCIGQENSDFTWQYKWVLSAEHSLPRSPTQGTCHKSSASLW